MGTAEADIAANNAALLEDAELTAAANAEPLAIMTADAAEELQAMLAEEQDAADAAIDKFNAFADAMDADADAEFAELDAEFADAIADANNAAINNVVDNALVRNAATE